MSRGVSLPTLTWVLPRYLRFRVPHIYNGNVPAMPECKTRTELCAFLLVWLKADTCVAAVGNVTVQPALRCNPTPNLSPLSSWISTDLKFSFLSGERERQMWAILFCKWGLRLWKWDPRGYFVFHVPLTSLYLTFRMSVAVCQITVDVIMHERSASPFS